MMDEPQIHPAAFVHAGARLGARTRVGPGAIIDEHVVIGADCEIRAHAVITGHTTLGDGNQVGYGAVIGAEPQDLAFDPKAVSRVVIGDRNVIREHATIHRGTKDGTETRLGSGCFLMAEAHVGHNCRIGDRVILASNGLCAGYVDVGDGAFVSGNAVIHQFCRMGRLAMLRGGGRISKDIPPFMIGDATNRVRGLNVVGLRRAGIGAAARAALKRAFHALFLSGRPMPEVLKELDGDGATAEVREVVAFIRASKRGIVAYRGGGEDDGD
ncbi:MAG TPA: acyl-ACP--UDP-N-acetylglucosamine O-acyltransferase [Verrucomicrobiae bacterium]|nr:acyl-ACP--UDP-N-acetylglucosamine O-acyltransferase [Verrucomicrobiae bacterium]